VSHILVMIANRAKINSTFSLKDLAGSAGRLDVVCRVVLSFQESKTFDTLYLVLRGMNVPISLVLQKDVKKFYTEQEVALDIKSAILGMPSRFSLLNMDYESVLESLSKDHTLVLLEETGSDILSYSLGNDNYAFILGDDKGFLEEQILYMKKICDVSISLGNIPYLSSQVVAILDYVLSKCIEVI